MDRRAELRASASAVGLNPELVSTTTGSVPASRERMRICRPATWWAGRGRSQVPGPPRRAWVARAEAMRAAALMAMSRPVPVVEPDVRRMRSVRAGTRVMRRARSDRTCPSSSPGAMGTSSGCGEPVRPSPPSAARAGRPSRPSRVGSRPRRARRSARAVRRAATSSGAVPPVRRRRAGGAGTPRSCHGPGRLGMRRGTERGRAGGGSAGLSGSVRVGPCVSSSSSWCSL